MTNMDNCTKPWPRAARSASGWTPSSATCPETAVDPAKTAGENIVAFNRALIEATKAVAGCYKVQIAYYEALGLVGMRAYAETLRLVRESGCRSLPISSAATSPRRQKCTPKRTLPATLKPTSSRWPPIWGWIPSAPICRTARSRARACSCSAAPPTPAASTLNTRPWPTAGPVYTMVGDALTKLGADYQGEHGYSSVGLVIGGTTGEEASTIRARYPGTFFLIPGYGAQGGKAADNRPVSQQRQRRRRQLQPRHPAGLEKAARRRLRRSRLQRVACA